MPTTSGPYTPVPDETIQAQSPLQGGGNAAAIAAVVINISPFELVISSGAGSPLTLVDPFTRNIVPLDATAGQQLTIDPMAIGVSAQGVTNLVYIQWYGATESVPGSYPSVITGTGAVTLGGAVLASDQSIGPGGSISPTAAGGIFRSCRIYLQTIGSASSALVSIQLTGGSFSIALEDFNVLTPGSGAPATAIVLPVPPFGAGGAIDTSLAILNNDSANHVSCMVIFDPASAKRSVPFPYEGGEVPTAPTHFAAPVVANGGQVLPAPPAGLAYYVFGIDSTTAAADQQNFRSGGVTFASTEVTAANGLGTSGDLGGLRVSGAIDYNALGVNQNDDVTIRYAYGP